MTPGSSTTRRVKKRRKILRLNSLTQPSLSSTPPKLAQRFHDVLPTYYRSEHVRPVIKTKPDGSRWVLTPEMQARSVLHLYQPL
jgi:hypothetical protein